jgi:hypothetical protein
MYLSWHCECRGRLSWGPEKKAYCICPASKTRLIARETISWMQNALGHYCLLGTRGVREIGGGTSNGHYKISCGTRVALLLPLLRPKKYNSLPAAV